MNIGMRNKRCGDNREAGFILPTSLMLLTLLTMLATTMYYISRSSMLTSAASNTSTTAIYYAETGANYMSWALSNDAELDSYNNYAGSYLAPVFAEAFMPANAATAVSVGDLSELDAYRWYPGPTAISDTGAGALGQIRYLDNSPMGGRAVCLESAATFSNCIDVSLSPASRVSPRMHKISASLPRYIKLDIASNGTITPSIPALPHHATPVVGQDIPQNGAIVWLTAVVFDPLLKFYRDVEIFPLNPIPNSIYTGIAVPSACTLGAAPGNCPCDGANIPTGALAPQACDANTGLWLVNYNIAVYAIAYVNGKPSYLLRSIIR